MYTYIPHPTNCRVSSAVMDMLAEEGAEGYGIYWMLLELLRDAPSYSIPYKPKSLAYGLHIADVDKLERIVNNYGLFSCNTDGNLSCNWLCEQMEVYDEKKKKLQEAGRRGAQSRWQGSQKENSMPIASLSLENSKPIALNVTQHDVTEQDITIPSEGSGEVVSSDYMEMLAKTQPAGHNPAYIAQVCLYYGMKVASCDYICERTDNANLTNPLYLRFCALVKRIQGEKWVPKHPDGFFLKKVFE